MTKDPVKEPKWLNDNDHDTLIVHRDDLRQVTGLLPPDVEMHVGTVLSEARYGMILLNLGDGLLQFEQRELDAVAFALNETFGVML